jgi:hypothetical protein
MLNIPTALVTSRDVRIVCFRLNSLITRDFKVRSLSICVEQAATSPGPKSFIFAICYWWKRLYPKRDLETQIRGLIPSTSPHYKDKPHSITCPLLPQHTWPILDRRAGNNSTLSCVLPNRVPKYTLQLCTLHYVLLLHIHTYTVITLHANTWRPHHRSGC